MKTIFGISKLDPPLDRCALTIGNFDGIHLAHQALLRQTRHAANQLTGPAVVLTFDPHPLHVVAPGREPPQLTPMPEKLRLVERQGIDIVVVARSEPALLNLEAEAFLRDVVHARFHPALLVEGSTFGFGKGRQGNPQLLRNLAKPLGYDVTIVDAVSVELIQGRRETVSSSLVRRLLSEGDVLGAARCLNRPYRLFGEVIEGEKRGRTLGFPTANLTIRGQLIPGDGVYAGEAWVGPQAYDCALNIGSAPTFAGVSRRVEVHLLDFSGDLYGQELAVDLRERLRAEQKFTSPSALAEQLHRDITAVRAMSAMHEKGAE